MTREVECNGCGRSFEAARSDARYCSSRCRTAAHRSRNAPELATSRKRHPITNEFRLDEAWEHVLDELCTYGFDVYGGKVSRASNEAWAPVETAIHNLLHLQAEHQEAS